MSAEDELGYSSTTELLPLKQSQKALTHNAYPDANSDQHESSTQPAARNATGTKGWMKWKSNPAICALPLFFAAIPVVLLLVFSKRLSHSLALNGCLPDGTFALPFTSSVWDAAQFFAITIPFTGRYLPGECFLTIGSSSGGPDGIPHYSYDRPCAGYTFAQVKVMDLAWDVIIGRCGQAALVALAYRLFSHAFDDLMSHGEVGYDVFASTKFQCGSFGSLCTLLKHVLGRVPLPITSRAKWLYLAMAVSTAYILAVPTTMSAMTGYTSVFDPSVSVFPSIYDNDTSTRGLYDCGGKLLPAWGKVTNRIVQDSPDSAYYGDVIAYPGMPIDPGDDDLSFGYDWKDCGCYHKECLR